MTRLKNLLEAGEDEKVASRHDLAEFVDRLQSALKEDRESWENPNLERYFEALAASLRDFDGYCLNRGRQIPDKPSWSDCAHFLVSAAIYE